MKFEWYKGTKNEDEKLERVSVIRSCKPALDIVLAVVEERLKLLQEELLKKKNYESPQWAMLQADQVGEARAYQYLKELLTLDRE